jgi:hypothetical protein
MRSEPDARVAWNKFKNSYTDWTFQDSVTFSILMS